MTKSEYPGTADDAARALREIAHSWADGHRYDPRLLIRAAVEAVVAGVDAPSLPLLAGLFRGEEAQASELFGRVADELGFGFHPPEDFWDGRLALARWWAGEIADGWLDPVEGACLIVEQVAEQFGETAELAPMVAQVVALQDPLAPHAEITAAIVRAAHELLLRIPAPPGRR
ncbi:hypothetical protein AB0K51_04815 [Kitasatospora sp. NPDC049285]|uniref:hypothetical protein n=1 Tax=Kitasatospora sp. NPDC049285 TaxID=3157096 RepID=UPI00342ACC35